MASVNINLRALRMQRPILADFQEIDRQLAAEGNDRGAAILAGTLVENALTQVVARRIPGAGHHYAALFENQGLFAGFDARITIANVLNIFGSVTLGNLNTVKHIRNTFAHASIPVSFATREIVAACDSLTQPANLKGRPWVTPKDKFGTVCWRISEDLLSYAAGCLRIRADLVDPSSFVPMTPAPLP